MMCVYDVLYPGYHQCLLHNTELTNGIMQTFNLINIFLLRRVSYPASHIHTLHSPPLPRPSALYIQTSFRSLWTIYVPAAHAFPPNTLLSR